MNDRIPRSAARKAAAETEQGNPMSAPIAHRNLPQLLLKARETLLAHFRPIITHFGLTEQQWRVMRTLSEQGEMEPRQICEACQILSPSLTGVLLRMEELGLVERRRVPEDQRRMLVSLTARSLDIIGRMAPLIEQQYRRLEEAVGKPLLDETYAQLDRLLSTRLDAVATVDLPPYDAPVSAPARRRKAANEDEARD